MNPDYQVALSPSRKRIGGEFTDWRSRPVVAPVHGPSKPRACVNCGAILRPSNTSDTCAPCAGTVEIPDWMLAILDRDGRESTVNTLAAIITGNGPGEQRRLNCVPQILALWGDGLNTYEIATALNIKRSAVQKVLLRTANREEI